MKLRKFIEKTLKELGDKNTTSRVTTDENYHYKFDIGIEPNMEVNEKSRNRVKFKVVVR